MCYTIITKKRKEVITFSEWFLGDYSNNYLFLKKPEKQRWLFIIERILIRRKNKLIDNFFEHKSLKIKEYSSNINEKKSIKRKKWI